ncbi:MAG: hypothetical protein IPO91_34605 [Chloroflexi bacterium]|nr:hypothetical protein [Chloroflexota bacterium]
MQNRPPAFESTALALTDWALKGLSGSAAYPVMSWSVTGGKYVRRVAARWRRRWGIA